MSDGTVCILESSSGFDATLSLLLVALRLWPSFACVDGRSEDGSVEGNRIRSGQFFDGRGLFRTGSRELLFLLFFGCSSADFLSIFFDIDCDLPVLRSALHLSGDRGSCVFALHSTEVMRSRSTFLLAGGATVVDFEGNGCTFSSGDAGAAAVVEFRTSAVFW